MMKQRLFFSLIGIAILLSTIFFIRKRIAKADNIANTLTINKPYTTDSTINISVIGDSWAYYAGERRFCNTLDSLLAENNINANTRNCGVPGAKSRDIYNYLLSSESPPHPIRNLIESGTDYAILFCGINDQNGQYGADFYAYHTMNILTSLVEAGITPIYLELPEWNIKELYKKYKITKYICYKALCIITSKQYDEAATTELYRNALYSQLRQSAINDKVIFIKWNEIKSVDIWDDDLHLNETGYRRLAEDIVKQASILKRHIRLQ